MHTTIIITLKYKKMSAYLFIYIYKLINGISYTYLFVYFIYNITILEI